MEYLIRHDNKLRGFENLNFQLDITKITKTEKNRSYPNLSNCCGTLLVQKKFCSNCSAEIVDDCQKKQFKLGKQTYSIPAAHLEEIKKQLDDNKIIIYEYRDMSEIDPLCYADTVFSSKQYSKAKREYIEYMELLQTTGKVGIGLTNISSRPYPVMIYHYKGHICIRLLHFANEMVPQPAIDYVPVNKEKLDLLRKIMALNTTSEQFELEEYKNSRQEKEEELIEMVLEGKELPKLETVEVKQADESDEILRLKALLAQ